MIFFAYVTIASVNCVCVYFCILHLRLLYGEVGGQLLHVREVRPARDGATAVRYQGAAVDANRPSETLRVRLEHHEPTQAQSPLLVSPGARHVTLDPADIGGGRAPLQRAWRATDFALPLLLAATQRRQGAQQ